MSYQAAVQKIQQAAAEQWEELDLSGMGLTELPPEIGQLGQLKRLILGRWDKGKWERFGNQLTTLPPELWKLQQLEKLSLSHNQINLIPAAISQLTNLQCLDLRDNQLSVIPGEISQLTNLQRLDLRFNQLSSIPELLERLTNLQYLYLSYNQISIIPDVIAKLTSLQALKLTDNQIIVIPDAIAKLVNLQYLSLSNNQISLIPDAIAQLVNLQTLYLGRNQISAIPESIAQLVNLQTLHLSRNQISAIPESIAQLVNLQVLALWGNQISVIPESIAQLVNLLTLGLDDNQISVIPAAIGQLHNLQGLGLSWNQISIIPDAILRLSKLEGFDLCFNPIGIPSELLSSSEDRKLPEAKLILDYYFTTRDPNQTQTLYESKLLLVGEGGAGKTSLANKILDPDYELKPTTEDISTEGIDILDWEFIGTNGQPYRIHIWDFGGQEIYHQTHQFFLTERACYLLVADDRRENTDHYFWLQSIQLLGKNSPVHLIQNEKGDRTCNLNPNQLRGEFPNLRDTHRTNLNNNRGLSELQTALQQELERLIPQGIPFPNKWLAVRYSLENDGRDYIDYAQYEDICRRHIITNRDEMLSLSRFLHDLGIVLHFQTDQILKHRLILKPNWGTTVVYKILDNDTVKTNLGQFSDTDLDNIWADPQYADMRHELLQLMKEFKVCYEIPRRPGQYIAPHLLSSDTPKYLPLTDNPLILRYKYKTFMPKGILTRFIVEMHRDIENASDPASAAVWKTGVVLSKGPTRAEIIEHYNQREIHIRVVGSRPRDFLTIINQKFEEIHEGFYGETIFEENPPYDTLIPCNCKDCKPNPNPFVFSLDRLHTCLDKGRYTIECHESGEDVNVRGLIDGVILEYADELAGEPDYGRVMRRRASRSRPKVQPPIVIENHIHNTNQQEQTMTEESKYTNDLKGANIANFANEVKDNARQQANQHNYAAQPQDLAQAAQDIKALIDQLATDYDTTTPTGKRKLSDRILETLEGNSTLQSRALNALKEAGKTAFEEAIDHPIAKVLVAGLEGYMEG
jgi:internalin A